MTTATILKAINTLPIAERMEIVEQVIHTIRLEMEAETLIVEETEENTRQS